MCPSKSSDHAVLIAFVPVLGAFVLILSYAVPNVNGYHVNSVQYRAPTGNVGAAVARKCEAGRRRAR